MKNQKSRLNLLRETLSLSQNEFASQIGVTQGALSQLESGKSHLSLETLQKISSTFDVNCNWLVNGTGTIFNEQKTKKHALITVDFDNNVTIPLINEEAKAGYLKNYGDGEYIKTLDTYKIPGYEKGNFRLFEIEGDSMVPTLHPREIVVAEFVDVWDKIGHGKLCVLMTDKGIVAKRVYLLDEDPKHFILKSDNPDFKTFSVPVDKVNEIWEVKAKITSIFTDVNNVNSEKIKSMEADINLLKKQMKNINKD